MSARRKVLLVGLDASEGDLALRWMREGRLPVLAGLAERGLVTPLESAGEHMPESSWASLISGCTPGEHGIYSWRIVRPGTVGRARMAGGGWRRPFWWVLREHAPDPKPRVVVFDIPYAGGPPDEGVTQLNGWGQRVTREGTSAPPRLFAEITSRHPAYPGWINRDYDRGPLSERRYARVLKGLARRRTEVALELLGRGEWECAIVSYTETHYAGHAFFHHHASGEPTRRRDRLAATGGLLDVYAETDRNLGRLLEAAGPDVNVIVFSTIGLRVNETSKDLLGEVLIALGYQVASAANPSSRGRGLAMDLATKVVPRFLRHRLRRLVPAGATEAIADRAWGEAIDWARSRAVSEAEPGSSWLRLNLIGREPGGIVSASERDALIAEIRANLEQLTVAGTGEPAVAEVIGVAEIAPGSQIKDAPDLLVRWTSGSRITAVSHPRLGVIDDAGGPYARTEHTGTGFLVAAGPDLAAGAAPDEQAARDVDIAPTVLHLFGAPIPAGMQGRALEWLLPGRKAPAIEPIDITAEPSF